MLIIPQMPDANKYFLVQVRQKIVSGAGNRFALSRTGETKKDKSKLLSVFVSGAGRENRTLISSLENLHTNHCTIPAAGVGYRD